jgi:hypothetical protein
MKQALHEATEWCNLIILETVYVVVERSMTIDLFSAPGMSSILVTATLITVFI